MLAALHVNEGQAVAAGDVLATLETTKSTAELEAETAGYVVGLRLKAGRIVTLGETLCYIADRPDWQPPAEPVSAPISETLASSETQPGGTTIEPSRSQPPPTGASTRLMAAGTTAPAREAAALPAGLRITQPALALAREHNLDLLALPPNRLVTESVVRELLASTSSIDTIDASAAVPGMLSAAFDPTALIIYGAGGHGKALIDLVRALSMYRIVGLIDDGLSLDDNVMGVPVLGGASELEGLRRQGIALAINAVGGIGNPAIRRTVFDRLAEAGFACPAVVHPRATVEPGAVLAPGVQVFANAYVGSDARIGFGCIVNTGAIVSHDCVLDAYANLSPGAILAGEVNIGAGALVGMGATINLRVTVGPGARIGNGATIKENIPPKGIVKAGTIWP